MDLLHALNSRAFPQCLAHPRAPPVQIEDVADGGVGLLFHGSGRDVAHSNSKLAAVLMSTLSLPLPIRTMTLRALNFSRSSLVRVTVWYIMVPTASFKTVLWISFEDCASQKAMVARFLGRGAVSTIQQHHQGWECRGPFMIPSQILSNCYLLTLCLSTRAILYGTLQLLDQKAKQSSENLWELAGV